MAMDAEAPSGDDELLQFLMERVSAGDREAFARLYDLTAPVVFGVALKVLRETREFAVLTTFSTRKRSLVQVQ